MSGVPLTKLKYLTVVLNSKLIDWYYKTLSVQLGSETVRMFSIYVSEIPVLKLQALEERELLRVYPPDTNSEKRVNNILYQSYSLTADEIEYIENNY